MRALLGVKELEVAFSILPFLSIDAVGSELWTALHEYINGDTHKSVFDNSFGKKRRLGSPLDQEDNIPHIDFMSAICMRFRMLDMRWEALDHAMNLS